MISKKSSTSGQSTSEYLQEHTDSLLYHDACYPIVCEKIKSMEGPHYILQLNLHSRRLQRMSVGHSLIVEAIEFLHLNIGGREAGKALRQYGRGILRHPVIPVPEIQFPHSAVQPSIPQRAVRKFFHRVRFHPAVSHTVDQQLETRMDLPLIPRPQYAGGGQCASGTVTTHHDPASVYLKFQRVVNTQLKVV